MLWFVVVLDIDSTWLTWSSFFYQSSRIAACCRSPLSSGWAATYCWTIFPFSSVHRVVNSFSSWSGFFPFTSNCVTAPFGLSLPYSCSCQCGVPVNLSPVAGFCLVWLADVAGGRRQYSGAWPCCHYHILRGGREKSKHTERHPYSL